MDARESNPAELQLVPIDGQTDVVDVPEDSLHIAFFTGPVKDLGRTVTAFSAGSGSRP